jgi:hypothetical protein
MAGKMSPDAQRRLGEIEALHGKVMAVNALIEQFASNTTNPETLSQPLKRGFGRLRMAFMVAGLDSVAQIAGAMEIASGRGSQHQTKSRILREAMGSIRFQIELEQRSILLAESRASDERRDEKEAAKLKPPAA